MSAPKKLSEIREELEKVKEELKTPLRLDMSKYEEAKREIEQEQKGKKK